MTPTRRTILVIAASCSLVLAVAAGSPAHAEGITKVRGTVLDNHGKPLPKVPLWFEATDTKKKVGPVKTGKSGAFIIATLDISVAKKWHVVPEFPGYKTVKVSYEIIDSYGEERGKGDVILGSKQEYPELTFALVGDDGHNLVDFVMAKEAEFVAAVQEERKKREQGEGATKASTAPSGGTAPASASSPPPAAEAPKVAGGVQMLTKAKQLTDAGRHAEAIELYRSYLEKDPQGNPAVYYYLGKSLFESGDDAAAEQAFRKGLELKSNMKGAHFYLGNLHLRAERFREAAAEYEQEALLTPDAESVQSNLGQAWMKAGEEEKALAAFVQATTLNPGKSENYMMMASIYEQRRDKARSAKNKVAEEENKSKAEEMYQKVIAIDPQNAATSFYNIGVHAWNENHAKEAVQAFRKVIEIDPKYAVAHRELARALVGTQSFAEAVTHFQEYLKLNPQAPDAKEIQDNIALLRK